MSMFYFILNVVNVIICLGNSSMTYRRGGRLFWAAWACGCSALAVLSLTIKH